MQISKKKNNPREKWSNLQEKKKIYIYISKYMAKIYIYLHLVHLITMTM